MTTIVQITAPGAFSIPVPANVSLMRVTAMAGGSGGNCWPGEGGSAGGQMWRVPVYVTPGGTLDGVVGDKGLGATLNNSYSATAGGDTIVGPIIIKGGQPPFPYISTGFSGLGGGSNSGGLTGLEAANNYGSAGANAPGIQGGYHYAGPAVCNILNSDQAPGGGGCYGGSGPFWGGGCGGGSSGYGSDGSGQRGAGSVNDNDGGLDGGPSCGLGVGAASGAGGASSPFGRGGTGGNACHGIGPNDGQAAAGNAYGAGGGGGTLQGTNFGQKGRGGNGVGGFVWVEY